MKKLICIALAGLMLMLTACGAAEPKTIYKDTLVITNEEKTFEGAKERYRAVLESLRTRVTLLEESHNQSVKLENPDSYFLDDNYILRSFDPFAVASFEMTDKINDSVTPESAPDIFKDDAGNSSKVVVKLLYLLSDDDLKLSCMCECSFHALDLFDPWNIRL